MRVLVVEDDPVLLGLVASGLEKAGMAVDTAADGQAALDQAALVEYDVVVLDRDLPRIHGDEVCRRLIASSPGPRVLMLTAAGSDSDQVEGLNLGADDYLAKPFSFAILIARTRALARRNARALPPQLVHGDVLLDTARRFATRRGVPLELSRKELAVLEVLLSADGAVVSAEELLDRAWDEQIDPFTNTVRVTMMKLRRKLGDPPLIVTAPGEGYRI
jgi:DNA-binding response OmpR family regulator